LNPGTRAILIVDNCTPAIHRQLADIARSAGTTISVITIEYDIREDQPEGTDVFSLDTSSPELIEKLIEKRAPHISQIDRRTIAESSGGNARVAVKRCRDGHARWRSLSVIDPTATTLLQRCE
jgi:nicotinate-nucleotide pyrophosphorylase